ncbi:UPF0481 protein At3g47200-like [Castanea sativa]|uniref:UPF0481 protein At3g47200-like n=1 Tax=Castanea sativa TaxID=21020 RepID=UPI003F64B53D
MEESASMQIQLATASINSEDQNIQKEADIPGGNEKKNDELVIEIIKMFERPEIPSWAQCIYKVPHYLRKLNEEAYTPQVISIGPLHHKNERLKAMEEHKERFFKGFRERSKIELEYLVDIIKKLEERIRGCYAETIDLDSNTFVKMVLVDASYIIELFFRHMSENNPLIEEPRAFAVMLDLVLLENQLPFFVIQELYNLAYPSPSNDLSLVKLSFIYFRQFNIQFINAHPNVKIEHFTDLLRTFLIPPPKKQRERGYRMINRLYTATQLHEVGVKFKVIASESCFDIKVEKGVLEIPRLVLNDRVEVVYRNIIALEQTRYIEEGYFTDYFIFMALLIKTRKDVDLLCDKNILFNHLDNSYAAELMIKNLNKGILLINMRRDYVDVGEELKNFYDQRPWRRRMALLKSEYFSTPSQATSTIVTLGVITVLTLIQTVCSIMQVKGSS